MTSETSRRRAPRALSLEHKLPLLISGLLLLTLLSVAWAAYAQVKRNALEATAERLAVVTRQLADLSRQSAAQRAAVMRGVADDPAIRAALAGPPDTPPGPAVAEAVQRLVTPTDSSPLVELWDARGQRRVLGARPAIRIEATLPSELLRAAGHTDTAHTGRLFSKGDSVFYWSVVAVRDPKGALSGYLAQRRQISTPPRTEQQIRQLIGEDVTVYVTDTVGDLWSTLGGMPTPVPHTTRTLPRGLFEFAGPKGEPHLASRSRVAGTPWTLILATPRATILARPRTFLRRMAMAMLVIVLVGAAAAWVLSRHVTRPIGTLAAAAEAIAAGDYGRRVDISRNDEVGRLGETFNVMAERVAESRRALEQRTEALRQSNEELARQTEVAQTANQAKSDFLAVMSHEIRTPINAILGYTQLMDLGIPDPVTEGQRAQLDRVRSSGHHLLGLVNELLDLARVESGQLAVLRERGVAADAADAALALLRPQAAAKGVTMTERCGGARDAIYVGDEQRVRQVLVNLLSNAVKFTMPGGRITLQCAVVERAPTELRLAGAGPWTTLAVEDTGIGIAAELTSRVFEPFVQAETGLTRSAGGTGLGLAISRRLARLMGGDLTLESKPGDGSRFTLWLPSASSRSSATPAAGSGATPASAATPSTPTTSLADAGHTLQRATEEIVRRYVARLREEPAIPQAGAHSDVELQDHLSTLLADVAQSLVMLRSPAGSDSADLLRDSGSIQQVVSERHGAQRFRLGWSEEAVVREHEVLREVVASALGGETTAETREVVSRFLEQAERVSVRGFREAARTEVGA